MKISELIQELTIQQKKHGDIEVIHDFRYLNLKADTPQSEMWFWCGKPRIKHILWSGEPKKVLRL